MYVNKIIWVEQGVRGTNNLMTGLPSCVCVIKRPSPLTDYLFSLSLLGEKSISLSCWYSIWHEAEW